MEHYCPNCQQYTNHSIIAKRETNSSYDDCHWAIKYYMIKCLGCESYSFKIESHDYESFYCDEYGGYQHPITEQTSPPYLENHKKLQETYYLPRQIKKVYIETLTAIKSGCYLLAGVGFRAIIEAVCIDKKIAGRNLNNKINSLSKLRLITEKESERLHAVRFLGNDSAHEMAEPKIDVLYVVLEIIEHLLKNIYIIDKVAKSKLDTVIKNYEEFEILLLSKIKKYQCGDNKSIAF